MSWFKDEILDDILGFSPPKAPAPIQVTFPDVDKQEVVSAGDRVRKRKTTQTNLGGGIGGQATISPAILFGM
jgi:hypothetical protein